MTPVGRVATAILFWGALVALARGHDAVAKDPPKKGLSKPLAPPAAPAPSAPAVIVRRTQTIESAIRTALGKAAVLGPKATVTIVVDPTPAVRRAEKAIGDALAAYSTVDGRPTSWQTAALGGSPSSSVTDPAQLRSALSQAIAQRGKPARDTIGSLRRTIKKTAGPGVVAYLAHGHFEDDCELEAFIADLLAQKKTLCVIGPEAAFEWSWGDVVADVGDWKFEKGDFKSTVAGVGNCPFGPEDPTAPWHGGETAFPLAPIALSQGARWSRETKPDAVGDRKLMEEIEEDLHGPPDPAKDPDGFDRFARRWVIPPDRAAQPEAYRAWLEGLGPAPDARNHVAYADWVAKLLASAPAAPAPPALAPAPPPAAGVMDDDRPVLDDLAVPSGFGPYGLMRAAGATGGLYVLWSWSRSHNVDAIRYDYAKCDAHAPDLRARSELLADVGKQPLEKALFETWAALHTSNRVGADRAVASCSPPWWGGGGAAIEGTLAELYLVGIVKGPKDRDEDVAAARAALSRIAAARKTIDTAIASAAGPDQGPTRRLRADAELAAHVLETVEYHVTEYLAHVSALDATAWKKTRGKPVYVRDVEWVKPADSDESVATTDAKPLESAAAQRALASRKAFLAKWKGTPFGAMVSRNPLLTFTEETWIEPRGGGGVPSPGSGSSSGSPGPTTGGSSGAPGPTTGK